MKHVSYTLRASFCDDTDTLANTMRNAAERITRCVPSPFGVLGATVDLGYCAAYLTPRTAERLLPECDCPAHAVGWLYSLVHDILRVCTQARVKLAPLDVAGTWSKLARDDASWIDAELFPTASERTALSLRLRFGHIGLVTAAKLALEPVPATNDAQIAFLGALANAGAHLSERYMVLDAAAQA